MAPKTLFFDEDCGNWTNMDELEAELEGISFPVNGTNVLGKFYETVTNRRRIVSHFSGYNVAFGD